MVAGIRRGDYGYMRNRLPTRHLVAAAALCAFVQLAAACSVGPAGPLAHPSRPVSHQRAGPPGTPAAGSAASPGRPHLARLSSPRRADWAVPGSVIRNLDTASGSPYRRGEKVVALTFDDGPSPVYTPQILRILAAARAPASFEIVGLDGAAYQGIVRAENAAGMALVNHTWTHADLALLPAPLWPAEVDRTSRLLQGVTRHPVRCLRLPYGLGDRAVVARLCARGLAELGWDVDPSDYLRPAAAVIARRVLAALHPGAIVIMHDAGGNRAHTVAALPAIIRGIRAAGYQIAPACAG
jgi:peptidoglycan-N-acetylglucosamine deacetylase